VFFDDENDLSVISQLTKSNMMRRVFAFAFASPSNGAQRWRPCLPNERTSSTSASTISSVTTGRQIQPTADLRPPDAESKKEPPLLLLLGGEFYVSPSGITRTLYSLHSTNSSTQDSLLSIEERHDMQAARKTFVVRAKQSRDATSLGRSIASIDIKEIDQRLLSSAGTGIITWEASIAMSLYFRTHPDKFVGDIVELGCGLGHGTVLSSMGGDSHQIKSITLTDGSPKVLNQCKQNVRHALSSTLTAKSTFPSWRVETLDWGDFVSSNSGKRRHQTYDTVIACDCAYLHRDVETLSRTVKELLSEKTSSKIHLFGPYNRSALLEVIQFLKDQLNMDVNIEWLELNRHRLKPSSRSMSHHWSDTQMTGLDDSAYASQGIVKFLHVTVTHKSKQAGAGPEESLAEID